LQTSKNKEQEIENIVDEIIYNINNANDSKWHHIFDFILIVMIPLLPKYPFWKNRNLMDYSFKITLLVLIYFSFLLNIFDFSHLKNLSIRDIILILFPLSTLFYWGCNFYKNRSSWVTYKIFDYLIFLNLTSILISIIMVSLLFSYLFRALFFKNMTLIIIPFLIILFSISGIFYIKNLRKKLGHKFRFVRYYPNLILAITYSIFKSGIKLCSKENFDEDCKKDIIDHKDVICGNNSFTILGIELQKDIGHLAILNKELENSLDYPIDELSEILEFMIDHYYHIDYERNSLSKYLDIDPMLGKKDIKRFVDNVINMIFFYCEPNIKEGLLALINSQFKVLNGEIPDETFDHFVSQLIQREKHNLSSIKTISEYSYLYASRLLSVTNVIISILIVLLTIFSIWLIRKGV